MTPAQIRALLWPPADGEWRVFAGSVLRAVNSLSLRYGRLVETEYGAFGPRGGECYRARLTAALIELAEASGG